MEQQTQKGLSAFGRHLLLEEKAGATIEKYLRDVTAFCRYAAGKPPDKELLIAYKEQLQEKGYAPRSINSMLAAINSYLVFCGKADCKVRFLKLQRQIYSSREKELSKAEYLQLLRAAYERPGLRVIMQTICSTGIRVSELKFFTVEAVRRQEISVQNKGKNRRVLIPKQLKKMLLEHAKKYGIRTGPIFVTKEGKLINRSTIWAQMKALCKKAGVSPEKVFPHNLRKLFARTFYQLEKDIAKLADVLGHSSIETTRIYIMTTGLEHQRKIERLGLVL